jgi:hypothetical protein
MRTRALALILLLTTTPALLPAQGRGAAELRAGRRFAEAGAVDSAVASYRRAIARDPGPWQYDYYLGAVLLGPGDRWDEAIVAFDSAWAKGYRTGIVRHNIARAHLFADRPDAALPEFRRAIAMFRTAIDTTRSAADRTHFRFQLADSYRWMAPLLWRRGERAEAAAAARAMIESDDRNEFRSAALSLGHVAFGDREYRIAEELYTLSERDRATGRPRTGLAWDQWPDWRVRTDAMQEVLAARAELGDVAPEYVHHVVVMVLRRQDVRTVDEGRPVHHREFITDRQVQEAEWRMRWLKQMVEGLSEGKLSLSWEIVNDTTDYRYEGDPRPAWVGDRRLLAPRFDSLDTVLRLWPWGMGEGTGGGTTFSLEPVSPKRALRGTINIHPEHSYGMWLHEFFHVVEAMTGISPTHGYYDENRGSFPGWTGDKNHQLDYFRYHFRTTLPAWGWRQMNFHLRHPTR